MATGLLTYMVRTVGKSRNALVQGGVALLAPRTFLRAVYRAATPPSNWHGRRAAFTLSFDVDYRADVEALPALWRMLAPFPFRASFACIGMWMEQYPEPHRALAAEGHEIVNHTYSHPDNEELNPDRTFNALPQAEQRAEIARCHLVCQDNLGIGPTVVRIPHFGNLQIDRVYPILRELGYQCSTSTLAVHGDSFGLPFETGEGILEVPVSTCPDHPHTVFDTWHCYRTPGGWHQRRGEFVSLFRWLLETGIETGGYINVYFDPRHCVATSDFRQALQVVRDHLSDLWVTGYTGLTEFWRAGTATQSLSSVALEVGD